MLREIAERIRQGYRTSAYPKGEPVLPERFKGRPVIEASLLADRGAAAEAACPAAAFRAGEAPSIDMGRCVFCGACAAASPKGAIGFTRDHKMMSWSREGLVVPPCPASAPPAPRAELRIFHGSLKLRQVSASGCNACEADINVLTTPAFDLGRFGIQVVASPRHADGIIVTGPVSENMALALEKTYKACPPPRIVIAVGACAISGGIWAGRPEARDGCARIVPVDMWIPGCPPHPLSILDGLLAAAGRRRNAE